jgi:predicted permease
MPDWNELVRSRLRNSGLAPSREAEVVEELAQHLNDRYSSLLAAGKSEDEAFQAVRADFEEGELDAELRRVEQAYVEPVALGAESSGSWLAGVWQDVRYGTRVLKLNPAFAAVCILSLALGIGANAAIFQLLNSVRMRTLPVKHADELAIIRIKDRKWASGRFSGRYAQVTNPMWQQIRDRQQGFSGIFAWGASMWNLNTGGQAEYARGIWVSGDFFNALGVPPVLGRVFNSGDDVKGCSSPGAVISYSFWQRRFGGDSGVIGRKLTLDGHPFEIVGVTPPDFYGIDVGRRYEVAVPICAEPVINGESSMYDVRHAWWLAIMGRLKPGWSLERATAQLETISPAVVEETLPPVYDAEGAKHYREYRFGAFAGGNGFSSLRADYESPLWILLTIAGLVLLIACANLANLMLARASTREREIAIRLALGAARGRLVRQLLTESLLIAAGGAVLGVGLARLLSGFLLRLLSTENSVVFLDLAFDWRVLGFTTALGVLTCLLFGLAPALKATNTPPASVMNSSGRSLTATRERFSLRRALVVTQVSLSLVLLVGALLFVRSLRNILTLDAGFQRDGILVVEVDFSRANVPADRRVAYRELLLDRVRNLPGVLSAGESSVVPVSGNGWNNNVVVNGKQLETNVNMVNISPGYFRSVGTPLIMGRDFDTRDNRQSPKVAIVNDEFARKIFAGQGPLGHTFKIAVYQGDTQFEFQVVGVVRNTKYYDLREDFGPIAFYPQAQDEKPDPYIAMLVRSDLELGSLVNGIKTTIAGVDPGISLDFRPLNQQIKQGLLRERLLATLSGFFGGLAALLATIGLYGVISYIVVRRTNEIGIRIALGATPRRILSMILSEAFVLLGFGLSIGLALSIALAGTASKLLFGLKPYDIATLAAASALLAAVAVAASVLPARRAARLEPTIALREE